MKRVGNLYSSITKFDNLLLAAKKAQRCKRFKPDILQFNYALEPELFQLQEELGLIKPSENLSNFVALAPTFCNVILANIFPASIMKFSNNSFAEKSNAPTP